MNFTLATIYHLLKSSKWWLIVQYSLIFHQSEGFEIQLKMLWQYTIEYYTKYLLREKTVFCKFSKLSHPKFNTHIITLLTQSLHSHFNNFISDIFIGHNPILLTPPPCRNHTGIMHSVYLVSFSLAVYQLTLPFIFSRPLNFEGLSQSCSLYV